MFFSPEINICFDSQSICAGRYGPENLCPQAAGNFVEHWPTTAFLQKYRSLSTRNCTNTKEWSTVGRSIFFIWIWFNDCLLIPYPRCQNLSTKDPCHKYVLAKHLCRILSSFTLETSLRRWLLEISCAIFIYRNYTQVFYGKVGKCGTFPFFLFQKRGILLFLDVKLPHFPYFPFSTWPFFTMI